MFFPNGDLWKVGEIDVWVPYGSEVDRSQIVKAVATSLNVTFFASAVPVVKRHRWRGLYSGFGTYCLQDGLWGLGTEIFLRFVKIAMARSLRSDNGAPAGNGFAEEKEKHRSLAQAWLQSRPLARCLILRIVLEPMRLYQEQHTNLTSLRRRQALQIDDVLHLLSGDGKDPAPLESLPFYKIVSGALEFEAMSRLAMLLIEPLLWADLVPEKFLTIEQQVVAFSVIASQGARLARLAARRKKQPMKTFLVDLVPTVENEICNDCKHTHTAWSLKHMQEHLGEKSADVKALGRAKRFHIAMEAELTIEVLESLHAQIRRRILSRGVQTHAVDIVDVCAQWVLDRARSRDKSHSWRFSAGRKCDDEVQSAAHQDGGDSPGSDQDQEINKNSCRGGGGLWRAFIRHETFGQKGGRPDIKSLSRKYKESSKEDLAKLLPLAALATQAHAASRSSALSSSFGPTSREISRLAHRKDATLMMKTAGGLQLALPHSAVGSASQSVAMSAALSACRDPGVMFDDAVRAGNLALRVHRRLASDDLKARVDHVRVWQESQGADALARWMSFAPNLMHLRSYLVAVPPKLNVCIFELRPDVSELAQATDGIFQTARHCCMASNLEQRFLKRLQPILHEACEEIKDGNRRGIAPQCFMVGKCVHEGEGLCLWRMRNTILRNMKEVFKQHSELRNALGSHEIVACFVGHRAAITCPWARKDAVETGLPVAAQREELWLSVAHMSFNPFSPAWLTMQRRGEDGDGALAGDGSLIPLCVSEDSRFLDEFEGVQLLDRGLAWSVAWFRLWAPTRTVLQFNPGNQFVKKVANAVDIWPPPRQPKAPRGDVAREEEDGAVAALEDGDVDEPLDVDEGAVDDAEQPPEESEEAMYFDEEFYVDEAVDDLDEDVGSADGRGVMLASVRFDNGGKISRYRDGRFEAVCGCDHHLPNGRCRLTRTSVGNVDSPAQGRPLGLLAAWIEEASQFSSREEHSSAFSLFLFSPERRRIGRVQLMRLPGPAALAALERVQRPDEGSEPEGWA